MVYEPPAVAVLGSIWELTQMPPPVRGGPPGKTGAHHDASQFQSNFSCVVDKTPGSNCKGANPNSP